MAYDEELAARLRGLVSSEPGVTEKKMFGGLAFLVQGNMAVAAGSKGGMMLRNDPARAEELVDDDVVTRMVMRGRPMDGWLLVSADRLDDDQLSRYVELGVDLARSLPPK